MAYVAPSTVTTLQTYTSAAHNIIVNDIIDHETRILALPRGYKGLTTLATDFTTTSASYVDVTALSVTFTAEASRRYRVELYFALSQTTASSGFAVISDGTSNLVEGGVPAIASQTAYNNIFAITAPSAGSVTYKAQVKTSGGTLRMFGTSARAELAARISVMDIGAV